MKKVDLAWSAGIFDGEGCVVLATRKYAHRTGYALRLTVANTDVRMLKRLKQIFKVGHLYTHKRKNVVRRDCWIWLLSGNNARNFLALVYPYLVTKRAQAKLAIQSGKHLLTTNHKEPRKILWQRNCQRELQRLKWIGFTGKIPTLGHRA